MRNRRNITPPRSGASISGAIKIAIMPQKLMLRVRTWGLTADHGRKITKALAALDTLPD
jgi:hypothetical protein